MPFQDNRLLAQVLPVLGLDDRYAASHLMLGPGNGLPSSLAVNELACGAVAAAALSGLAVRGGEHVRVNPRQVSVAMRNDQLQGIDGRVAESFAPVSGFFRTADGWVRTHGNYPHHARRLLQELGLSDQAERREIAEAISRRSAQHLEDTVTAAGGVVVRVREAEEWRASEQGQGVDTVPLLEVVEMSEAPAREVPYRPKVLDLTRVLAGPVATQTLGYLGADVLRVDSPRLPEIGWLYVATGADKRSCLLDLADHDDRATFEELLAKADVLVTGYRPGALAAYGLDSETLAARHPGLVLASLSAWGPHGPWSGRRGFDSIVQAATGIAMRESRDGSAPGALSAQVLDHATGYLLAAGAFSALRRRSMDGGTWRVSAHLARTAHWLLDAEPDDDTGQLVAKPEEFQSVTRGAAGLVLQSKPAFGIAGKHSFQRASGVWGGDEARWADYHTDPSTTGSIPVIPRPGP